MVLLLDFGEDFEVVLTDFYFGLVLLESLFFLLVEVVFVVEVLF